jgi:signal transduction histidine kinase
VRAALDDVRASRSRLALSTAEERRRLERDLHDGAQQRIVAIGMRLRAIQRRLRPGDPASRELDDAVEALESTIAELRRLAHGIRPSRLDDGLASALHALAHDTTVPIDLEVVDLDLLETVASAAHFVVAEAVANALKHSGADRIEVRVQHCGNDLRISVADNGGGGAAPGFGLTSMRDRVSSVGGSLTTHSPVGRGTTITAVIPCGL